MKPEQISEYVVFISAATIIGVMTSFFYIMFYEKLRPLDGLRIIVSKSLANIGLLMRAVTVINDVNLNTITPEGYRLINQDKQRAMVLLNTKGTNSCETSSMHVNEECSNKELNGYQKDVIATDVPHVKVNTELGDCVKPSKAVSQETGRFPRKKPKHLLDYPGTRNVKNVGVRNMPRKANSAGV